jgi:hypothetical protein
LFLDLVRGFWFCRFGSREERGGNFGGWFCWGVRQGNFEAPMKRRTEFKCLNCSEFQRADYRNGGRQHYCGKEPCRKASKAASQTRWLSKPENADYFRGADNVQRVREWRKRHPDYWRKKNAAVEDALQERCSSQVSKDEVITESRVRPALQEAWFMQPAVLVGLISTVTGSALQEDIARSAHCFLLRGQDILGVARAPAHPP